MAYKISQFTNIVGSVNGRGLTFHAGSEGSKIRSTSPGRISKQSSRKKSLEKAVDTMSRSTSKSTNSTKVSDRFNFRGKTRIVVIDSGKIDTFGDNSTRGLGTSRDNRKRKVGSSSRFVPAGGRTSWRSRGAGVIDIKDKRIASRALAGSTRGVDPNVMRKPTLSEGGSDFKKIENLVKAAINNVSSRSNEVGSDKNDISVGFSSNRTGKTKGSVDKSKRLSVRNEEYRNLREEIRNIVFQMGAQFESQSIELHMSLAAETKGRRGRSKKIQQRIDPGLYSPALAASSQSSGNASIFSDTQGDNDNRASVSEMMFLQNFNHGFSVTGVNLASSKISQRNRGRGSKKTTRVIGRSSGKSDHRLPARNTSGRATGGETAPNIKGGHIGTSMVGSSVYVPSSGTATISESRDIDYATILGSMYTAAYIVYDMLGAEGIYSIYEALLAKKGISNSRAYIIGAFEFIPAYNSGELTTGGKFLDMQHTYKTAMESTTLATIQSVYGTFFSRDERFMPTTTVQITMYADAQKAMQLIGGM